MEMVDYLMEKGVMNIMISCTTGAGTHAINMKNKKELFYFREEETDEMFRHEEFYEDVMDKRCMCQEEQLQEMDRERENLRDAHLDDYGERSDRVRFMDRMIFSWKSIDRGVKHAEPSRCAALRDTSRKWS